MGSLSIGTIPLDLCGFVSEIFSPKTVTRIITWWRHQWRHKVRINYPWGLYRHTIQDPQGSLPEKHFIEKSWRHHYDVMRSRDIIGLGAWPIDRPWSISYYIIGLHTGRIIIIFVKLTIKTYIIASIGVGDGWGVVGGRDLQPTHPPLPPQKKKENGKNIFRAIIIYNLSILLIFHNYIWCLTSRPNW